MSFIKRSRSVPFVCLSNCNSKRIGGSDHRIVIRIVHRILPEGEGRSRDGWSLGGGGDPGDVRFRGLGLVV